MDLAWYEAAVASLGLVVSVFGLYWLIRYVQQTTIIANETERQGDILSRPAISVRLGVREDPVGNRIFSSVGTEIVNHSNVHANIKLKLKAHILKAGADKARVFDAQYPYNGDIWPFSAGQGFNGNFTFDKLVNTQLAADEKLWIEGLIESSPYDVNDYRPAPPIRYKWKNHTKEWVPYPPEPPSN